MKSQVLLKDVADGWAMRSGSNGRSGRGLEAVRVKTLAEIKAEKQQQREDASDGEAPKAAVRGNSNTELKEAQKEQQESGTSKKESRGGGEKRKRSEPPGEVKTLEQIKREKAEKRERGEHAEGDEHVHDDPELQHKHATLSSGGEQVGVSMSVKIPEHKRKELEEKRKRLQDQHQ